MCWMGLGMSVRYGYVSKCLIHIFGEIEGSRHHIVLFLAASICLQHTESQWVGIIFILGIRIFPNNIKMHQNKRKYDYGQHQPYTFFQSIKWLLWHDPSPIYSHPEHTDTSILSQFQFSIRIRPKPQPLLPKISSKSKSVYWSCSKKQVIIYKIP